MILAIDIGGTKLAAALITDDVVIDSCRINTPKSGTAGDLTGALEALIMPLKDRADSVVVASTGIIDKGRLTAVNPDNIGGLNHYPLQSVLETLSGLPVKLLNDAQAAAWGEYCLLGNGSGNGSGNGEQSNCQNMAFITVSTGVGAGLVINGELLTGPGGLAGHAGHMTLDINGPKCGCGRTGCVEALASGTAIGRLASKIYKTELDGKALFERYHQGEQNARVVVDRSAKAIAELLGNLRALLDIEIAVIGGSVGLAEGYLARVHYFMEQQPALYRVAARPARMGQDAGVRGAAMWACR